MSLFVFNPFRISEELTPPAIRKVKMMAWLRVLIRPIKYVSDLFFNDFCKGANYADYNNATVYIKYDRVVWSDLAVYELKVSTSTGVNPTGDSLSSTNWRKIQDYFIGVDERVRFNGQLIVFEYAINKHFRVTSAPYIYVGDFPHGATNINVELNVPIAVWTALGPNATSRNNRLIQFAQQYTLGGYSHSVVTY